MMQKFSYENGNETTQVEIVNWISYDFWGFFPLFTFLLF